MGRVWGVCGAGRGLPRRLPRPRCARLGTVAHRPGRRCDRHPGALAVRAGRNAQFSLVIGVPASRLPRCSHRGRSANGTASGRAGRGGHPAGLRRRGRLPRPGHRRGRSSACFASRKWLTVIATAALVRSSPSRRSASSRRSSSGAALFLTLGLVLLATGYLADRGRRTLVADRGDLARAESSGSSRWRRLAVVLVAQTVLLGFARSGASLGPAHRVRDRPASPPTTRSTRSGARTCSRAIPTCRPSIWGREERRDGIRALCGRWATTGWAAHWSQTHRPPAPSHLRRHELAAAVALRTGSCHRAMPSRPTSSPQRRACHDTRRPVRPRGPRRLAFGP